MAKERRETGGRSKGRRERETGGGTGGVGKESKGKGVGVGELRESRLKMKSFIPFNKRGGGGRRGGREMSRLTRGRGREMVVVFEGDGVEVGGGRDGGGGGGRGSMDDEGVLVGEVDGIGTGLWLLW